MLVLAYDILPRKQGFTIKLGSHEIWDFDVAQISTYATHLFISHAHADHLPTRKIPHNITIVTSKETYALLKYFKKINPNHTNVIFTDTEFSQTKVQFISAGHTIGAKAFFLEFQTGETLLYTGDFSLQKKPGVQSFTPKHAEHVIMEATYGRKDYVFPMADHILEQAGMLVSDALKRSAVILRAYPYGKTQTILASDLGKHVTSISQKGHDITRLLNDFGYKLSLPRILKRPLEKGDVHLASPRESIPIKSGVDTLEITFTGWALTNRIKPGSTSKQNNSNNYSVMLPLSDHADFKHLLLASKLMNPSLIGVFCGYKKYFVNVLRKQGFFAYDFQDSQLALDTYFSFI